MIQHIIDAQYKQPSGLLGYFIGARMVRDHRSENIWTVASLSPRPTDRILELGFGAGFAIQRLARVVTKGRVAGIDFSRTMVRAATRRNAWAIRRGRVELHHGDVTALPFADEAFDKLFSIHSIYFWPQPVAALKEALRVLKPGGCLMLTVLPKEHWTGDNPDMAVGTPDCTPYTAVELQQLLKDAGFRSSHVEFDINRARRSNFAVVGVK